VRIRGEHVVNRLQFNHTDVAADVADYAADEWT
jgi:hypothetical protein